MATPSQLRNQGKKIGVKLAGNRVWHEYLLQGKSYILEIETENIHRVSN